MALPFRRRARLHFVFLCGLSAAPSTTAWAQSDVALPAVTITATPLGSDLFEAVAPATVLQGPELRLKQQSTLGDTLANEPGVNATHFGPNASRPVVRGLDGERVRILQNGASVIDASALSYDHAVSLDPLLADGIEVVRGPAALLYGGNAIGGVVNVIDSRIPRAALGQGFEGAVDTRYDSGKRERAGAARVDFGDDRLLFHADAFGRESGDQRIPDLQRSGALRRAQPLASGAREQDDELPNSDARTHGGAFGASVLLNNDGYSGLSWQEYASQYGTVAEENVRIHMRQERFDFAGELRTAEGEGGFVEALKYKFAHSDYRHEEIEDGVVGTVFGNRGFDGRVEMLHRALDTKAGPFKGAFGAQWSRSDLEAQGDEAFLPGTQSDSRALFVYEELPLSSAQRAPKLSFGGRIEQVKVRADAFVAASADERRFTPHSASTGLTLPLSAATTLAANLTYSERAPSAQELYANGPHIATAAFEVGDRSLSEERSTALDLGVRHKTADWRAQASVFYNRFQDYIALQSAVDGAGRPLFRDADNRATPPTTDPTTLNEPLQLYLYRPVPAMFQGFEAQTAWPLWRRAGRKLELELRSDYTRAEDRETGEPLPRIPAWRYGAALVFDSERLHGRFEAQHARAQKREPDGETPSDAYTLLNAGLTYTVRRSGVEWEASLGVYNLLNEDARPSTSFLRDIAPLPARSLNAGLKAVF